MPFLFLPSTQNRGGHWLAGGGPIRAPWAMAAAGNEGERGREVRGCDSRPHLRLGRRVEAGRRERAAAALVARGGGASAREERLEAAEVVAGMAGGSGSLL